MKKVTKEIRCVYEAGLENMVVLVSTRLDGKNYVMTSGTVAEVSRKTPMLCSLDDKSLSPKGSACSNFLLAFAKVLFVNSHQISHDKGSGNCCYSIDRKIISL